MQKKLKNIRVYFKTRPVLKAYIFGSYARNDADKSRGIDILLS